jgi:FAD/FMN-containing dehydrogenase
VPISRLGECVIETKRDIEQSGLIAPIIGHAGDGNFHAGVAVMMDDAEEVARLMRQAVRKARRRSCRVCIAASKDLTSSTDITPFAAIRWARTKKSPDGVSLPRPKLLS